MTKLGDTVRGARVLSARIREQAGNPDGRMPLMDHIRELRNRLVKIALALLVGTGIGLIPQVLQPGLELRRAPVLRGHHRRPHRLPR